MYSFEEILRFPSESPVLRTWFQILSRLFASLSEDDAKNSNLYKDVEYGLSFFDNLFKKKAKKFDVKHLLGFIPLLLKNITSTLLDQLVISRFWNLKLASIDPKHLDEAHSIIRKWECLILRLIMRYGESLHGLF